LCCFVVVWCEKPERFSLRLFLIKRGIIGQNLEKAQKTQKILAISKAHDDLIAAKQ